MDISGLKPGESIRAAEFIELGFNRYVRSSVSFLLPLSPFPQVYAHFDPSVELIFRNSLFPSISNDIQLGEKTGME